MGLMLTISQVKSAYQLCLIIRTCGSSSTDRTNTYCVRPLAYFGHGYNYNVISVDWEKLAAAPWYNVAAEGTEVVGDKVARLVQYLVLKGLVTLDNVHIAGNVICSSLLMKNSPQ